MSEDMPQMVSPKATNTFEGVMILGQDESMLLSLSNAEKLRDQLSECLWTAQGLQKVTVIAEDIDAGVKIVLNDNQYRVKNVLSGINDSIVLQFEDYFGVPLELTVPDDFEMTALEAIE
jgi:hypothetical protein